jgi:O-antigen/teichoic acid export membrane protein
MKSILGQNLVITIISKTLSFVAAFYIIKILSKQDYAMYNQLLVMLTFLPYFEIAITRGFFIEYPRYLHTKTQEECNRLFFNYSIFIIIIYLILGSFVFIGNIPKSLSFCAIVFGQFLFTKFIEVAYTYYNSNLNMSPIYSTP